MDIRWFRSEDATEVTGCIVELQTYERTLDERVLPGEAVEGWYLDHLLKACAEQDGTLFVAEDGGRVVGFAAVQSRVPNEDVDESDYHFALISDVGVNESHRGQGIGRALIEACEAFARGSGRALAQDRRTGAEPSGPRPLRALRVRRPPGVAGEAPVGDVIAATGKAGAYGRSPLTAAGESYAPTSGAS